MGASGTVYRVMRARGTVVPGAGWDSPAWRDIPALSIIHPMGDPPAHRPLAQAKLQYDADSVNAVFRVEDRWVLSRVMDYQGDVCTDSCVEFFFTPGTDLGQGYFNLEVNCGGTVLFTHRHSRDEKVIDIPREDARSLEVAHTLPSRIEKETPNPVTWEVSYRVPIAVLRAHAPVATPAADVLWRANFYKCADASSHPHWLTWAPVEWPHPDFHRKEFFGTLAFE